MERVLKRRRPPDRLVANDLHRSLVQLCGLLIRLDADEGSTE